MKPLVTIQRIFNRPAGCSFSTSCRNYAELRAATDGLRQLENERRASLGYEPVEKVPGISLDAKYGKGSRKSLHADMTSDPRWMDIYMTVVRASDGEPVESYERLAGDIYLPDWNELTAVVREVNFDGNAVTGEFGTAHSYVSQLKRNGKMQDGLEPVSVYGAVMTLSAQTVMGQRSGMSYAGGHMTIPAGSLKVYDNLGRPSANMWWGIIDELGEELGFDAPRIEGLVGVFKDPTLRGFVFSVPTLITESEIIKIWKKSADMKEHERMFSVGVSEMPGYISQNADMREEIAPRVDPVRPLLPSGAAVLLTQLRRYSPKSFDGVIQSLDGLFATKEGYYVE